jgi:hypothetical protein
MKSLMSYITSTIGRHDDVISVLAIENTNRTSPLIDGFDGLVLVVTRNSTQVNYISHYIKHDTRIQERRIDPAGLEHWLLVGENRNIIHWLVQGEILLDHDAYLTGLRQQLLDFPPELRERKLLIEFSHFLRRYLQSKEYLQNGHLLDAYSSILESLHHWARIVIIEEGCHPEVTVWNQVRKINPGVYKLYEELTLSGETLEQRVQLVLLACEFSVMSKMGHCCVMLTRILQSRELPWSLADLLEYPDLKELNLDISLILKKLAQKALIDEVVVALDDTMDIFELQYTC